MGNELVSALRPLIPAESGRFCPRLVPAALGLPGEKRQADRQTDGRFSSLKRCLLFFGGSTCCFPAACQASGCFPVASWFPLAFCSCSDSQFWVWCAGWGIRIGFNESSAGFVLLLSTRNFCHVAVCLFHPFFLLLHTHTHPWPHCHSWKVQQPYSAVSDLVVPWSLKIHLLKAVFETDFYCVSESDVCMELVLKGCGCSFLMLVKADLP